MNDSSATEEWRDAPGYPGYQVSDQGRVRSVDRWVEIANHRRFYRGRIRKFSRDRVGRLRVPLPSPDGTVHTRTVHQLVLETFVGPAPSGMFGCHNDGDLNNNRLSNLRWDTPSSNMLDAVRHGTHYTASKTHCKQGHEYTPENTYLRARGAGRDCRECRRKSVREAMRRRRALLKAS